MSATPSLAWGVYDTMVWRWKLGEGEGGDDDMKDEEEDVPVNPLGESPCKDRIEDGVGAVAVLVTTMSVA